MYAKKLGTSGKLYFWADKSFSQVVTSQNIPNKGAQSQPDFLENKELKMHIDLKK